MSLDHLDPEIVNDFLTEAGELLDKLDQDLVDLENAPEDPDLINGIFRAMHTIKGSASFLGLDGLTEFAHAAEDGLNMVRQGKATITSESMDHLLAAVDVLRRQMQEVADGQMPGEGPGDLITALRAIGGDGPADDTADPETDAQTDQAADGQMLDLPDSKKDLLPFMVDDLIQSLKHIGEVIDHVHADSDLAAASGEMVEITGELVRSVDFFDLEQLTAEVKALDQFANALGQMNAEPLVQARPRSLALVDVLNRRAQALVQSRLIDVDSGTLLQRLVAVCNGEALPEEAQLEPDATIVAALACDGIAAPQPKLADADTTGAEDKPDAAAKADGAEQQAAGGGSGSGESTIRVHVSRLESLLNLIGELVLQKNRVLGMTKRIKEGHVDNDTMDDMEQVASDLERVTADLQLSVMKTRLQPLSKLFSRYPRVIRDLARMTDKKINLEITGGETEVDKTVIESLGDPLVHILRNSADHGVENPQDREAAGKDPTGTIQLSARHEGQHVIIQIADDGKGIDPKALGAKAVEKGVVSQEELAAMPDSNILQLIFAPGFSTAAEVSDLSGRGVGMDVVRTNIAKINGMVDVESRPGQGTCVSIKIPLTLAIMPAMMVGVSDSLYAVPLSNVREIVRPDEQRLSTIRGQLVMRLRDRVLPLVSLNDRFHAINQTSKFAVVVGLADQNVGLMVDRLLGQEEIVIKPLDNMFEKSNDISGATVREDGGVSLILDIAAIIESIGRSSAARTAA